ncbi:MAG: hypothetical protein ACREDR_49260, partial [Blastocatellia bacterium]
REDRVAASPVNPAVERGRESELQPVSESLKPDQVGAAGRDASSLLLGTWDPDASRPGEA